MASPTRWHAPSRPSPTGATMAARGYRLDAVGPEYRLYLLTLADSAQEAATLALGTCRSPSIATALLAALMAQERER